MAITTMCECCADKLAKNRALHEVSQSFLGRCPMCFLPGKLYKYDIGPTYAELERKRRQAKAAEKRSGGGERARAGRRAR